MKSWMLEVNPDRKDKGEEDDEGSTEQDLVKTARVPVEKEERDDGE